MVASAPDDQREIDGSRSFVVGPDDGEARWWSPLRLPDGADDPLPEGTTALECVDAALPRSSDTYDTGRKRRLMTARKRLLLLGAVVLALNIVVLTPIAVLANLPAQFGGSGTDAGGEFLSRGTAISAPLAPLLALGLSLLLLRRSDGWAAVGIVGTGLIGILFLIGAVGEGFSDATPEVSKAVLLAAGLGVGALAASMVGLAVAAVLELWGVPDPSPTAGRKAPFTPRIDAD